jgi:hypothetical protein
MTRIWQFFFATGEPLNWSAAAYAWSEMLLGIARPLFTLPLGRPFEGQPDAAVVTAAVALACAPLLCGWWFWRRHQLFAAGISITAAISAWMGAWSALHVRGGIGDYHLFWLSVLGAIDFACIASVVSQALAHRTARWIARAPIARLSGQGLVAAVAIMACVPFVQMARLSQTTGPQEAIISRVVPEFLAALPHTGNRNPHVRFGDGMWSEATGIILQLSKTGVDFTLEPHLTLFFGERHTRTGREDALVDIVRQDRHEALLKRPGTVMLAKDDESGLYVDEVSLVDYPAYRPR